MSKKDELRSFYSQTLESLDCYPNDEGMLTLKYGDAESPCMVGEKRLVMPTDQYLKAGDWTSVVPFHPLSEHLLRGESDVIHTLVNLVEFRSRAVLTTLMAKLMSIAADEQYHKNLKPRQADLLKAVPKANNKTIKALDKLIRRSFSEFLKVYLKRDGTWHGKEYRRVAVVHSPVYDELINNEGTHVAGVDLGSKAARHAIAELMEFILPELANTDTYSFGSAASVAPYFHSLMGAYGNLMTRLNEVIKKYKPHLTEADAMTTDLHYLEDLDRIDQWKEVIPPLPGNQGAAAKGEEESSPNPAQYVSQAAHVNATESAAQVAQPAPAPTPQVAQPGPTQQPPTAPAAPAVAQPGGAPAPAASGGKSERGVDWNSMKPHAQPYGQPPMGSGYGQPPMGAGYGQPTGQFAQMVPAAPPTNQFGGYGNFGGGWGGGSSL